MQHDSFMLKFRAASFSIYSICFVMEKRGGVRQRLQQAQDAQNANVASRLAHYLICSWAWGEMSPQQVQRIAHLAKQDMDNAQANSSTVQEWDMLASIGSYGAYPNNCNRDLQSKFDSSKWAKPSAFTVPMKNNGQGSEVSVQQAFWPHEVFASMYHNYKSNWSKRICPSSEAAASFWGAVRGTEEYESHPVKGRSTHATHGIPISMGWRSHYW